MKYKGRARSKNIDDRRAGGRSAGGSNFKLPTGGKGKMSIAGIVVMLVVVFLSQRNPELAEQLLGSDSPSTSQPYQASAEEQELAEFLGVVLKETEDVWNEVLPDQAGRRYVEPTMVYFSGAVQSGCGRATKEVGPFYCSADNTLYIDLSFKKDLEQRFGAKGDFAMAYVVAHEVAHHVQNLQGATGMVHSKKGRVSQAEYNQLSVRLELQADFYAGLWAHYTSKWTDLMEHGDIDEALNAAFAIGDDRIQMMGRGSVIPESFTHGTSKQRMRWFKKGFETGLMAKGDTFSARNL